jgi:hypothetical protein
MFNNKCKQMFYYLQGKIEGILIIKYRRLDKSDKRKKLRFEPVIRQKTGTSLLG